MSVVFVFKQKTAYEVRISDWSSDVCSSDLLSHTKEDQFWLDRTQRAGPNHFPVLADTSFYDVESRGPFESYQMLRDLGIPVHLKTLGAHDGYPNGTDGPQPASQRWFDHFQIGRASCRERVWQYV